MMESAEEIFSKAFNSVTSRFAAIFSLRKVADLGVPAVTPAIYQEWKDFAFDLFHNDENDKFFIDKQGALETAGGVENLGQEIAQNEIAKFRSAIDGASLIFAHSVVDDAVLEYLKVTCAHSTEPWIPFIENRNVKLSEISGKNYAQLVDEKISILLNELERQSLLVKSDRLFQICRPDADFSPINDFTFSRNRFTSVPLTINKKA